MQNIEVIIGGAAGEGSKKAGHLIAKLFNSHGLRVFIHEDYESVIKGGQNFSHISVATEERNAIGEKVDFLLALNKDIILRQKEKLKEDGVLMHDCQEEDFCSQKTIKVSLNDIVNEAGGIPLMKNTALVASFAKAMGMMWEDIEGVLRKELPVATEKNIEVAKLAYDKTEKVREIVKSNDELLPLFSGNEAVALGAIDAGLETYIAYPMTPSTGVLNFLAEVEGVRVFQPESEISVINMALGCAYTGRRTMVGTSGGGFALMTEGVSMSAQSETPLAILMSQRMGPASGVPTYNSQGDLLFTLNSGHGDMMRFIVAPGDADEAYYLTGKALNIAWEYQMPAIVLLDKEVSENTYEFQKREEVTKGDIKKGEASEDYNRYEGEDISPMLFPGDGAVVKVTSYEHTKKGVATEKGEEIVAMQEKRIKKHEKLKEHLESFETVKVYQEGSVAVIFWGSTKGAVLAAAKNLPPVKLVQIKVLQPFPEKKLKEVLEGVEKVICIESNATGQMTQVLRANGINVDEKILRYDGRPFTIDEVEERLKKVI